MVSTSFNVQNIASKEIDSTKFDCYVKAFTNIEYMKLNPNFDKDIYIDGLNNEIKKLEKNQNNEDKIHCIEFEKSIIEKMNLLYEIGKSKSTDDENYQVSSAIHTSNKSSKSRSRPTSNKSSKSSRTSKSSRYTRSNKSAKL